MVGGMGTRIQAFLERYFTHPSRLYIGCSYIIRLRRVSLLFESHNARKVTLEKHLYTRTHTANQIAHPILLGFHGQSFIIIIAKWPRPEKYGNH